MALQGIQLPSIAGVLSFKDFSNQLNNANAGVKNVANYLLAEHSKDNEREYQAEQAEKQRDFQADEARKQRSWNYEQNRLNRKNAWELQDAKFKNDKELQNLSLDKAAAEKKKVAGSNMAYMLKAQYDPSNKGSMIQAQNNIWKVMEDAKAAGYTDEELKPLVTKALQLQSDMNDYQKKADFKQSHDTARSRIMEAINAGAGDAAMDIIADNADFFDQPELDEFQKRIEAQKRKDYRERYNEGRQYRKDREQDNQDAFGARILGG